jgi:cytochrome P450
LAPIREPTRGLTNFIVWSMQIVSTQALNAGVPTHVPAELVWNHSFAEFAHELDDPYLSAARMHDGPDVIWARDASYGNPGWILTRHAQIREAFADYVHFSSARTHSSVGQLLGVTWRLNPLDFDPPVHQAYRQILNPFFFPRAVSDLDVAVRQVCESLIAQFERRGSCEFIEEFATKFPAYVFVALMGMPRTLLPQFLAWEQDLLRGTNNIARVTAARSIFRYLEGFAGEQRSNPTTGLMQGIFSARIEGRPLNEGEIMGMLYLLYIGGLDTVYGSLGWIMRHLAVDMPLQQRLRARPEDISLAVEEFTRAFGVAAPSRTIAQDLEFHGVTMRRGDPALLPTYLASRDPKAFENPHVIDIDRRARNNLSFGTGPHTCLGFHLARREIKIVIEAVLARLGTMRIPQGEHYEFHTGSVLGIDRLPLTWGQ